MTSSWKTSGFTLEDCKGEVYRLYIGEDRQLEDVREIIEQNYGITAT